MNKTIGLETYKIQYDEIAFSTDGSSMMEKISSIIEFRIEDVIQNNFESIFLIRNGDITVQGIIELNVIFIKQVILLSDIFKSVCSFSEI